MQRAGDFTDTRDKTVYRTFIEKSGKRWIGENLRFNSQYSRPLDIINDDDRYGRIYSYDDAAQSTPDGWRLPTMSDWCRLEKALDRELFGFPPDTLRMRGGGHYYWSSSRRLNWFLKSSPGSRYVVQFGGSQMSKHPEFIDEMFLVRCIED